MGSSYFFLFRDHKTIVSSDLIDELQGEGWAMAAVTGCDMFDISTVDATSHPSLWDSLKAEGNYLFTENANACEACMR